MAAPLTEPRPPSPEAEEELGKYLLNRPAGRQALESGLEEIEALESRWASRGNAWRYAVALAIYGFASWGTARQLEIRKTLGFLPLALALRTPPPSLHAQAVWLPRFNHNNSATFI